MKHGKIPCAECPWRRDQPAGRFPPERYRALAKSAYDVSFTQFACHKSPEGEEFACAGFLLRGAMYNVGVRLALAEGRYDLTRVSSPFELYSNYREMAEFNGVDPDDLILEDCRDNE